MKQELDVLLEQLDELLGEPVVDPDDALEQGLEALDEVTGGGATDEEVEEALFDVDDLVAAAIWCGRPEVVRAGALRAARIVREIPDVFAPIADLAKEIARLPAIAEHLDLYDYWLAVSDAGAYADDADRS